MTDILARIVMTYQANHYRLYDRVVRPALVELPLISEAELPVDTEEQRWEFARILTQNSLSAEVRRCYAMALGAVFEREVRDWLQLALSDADRLKVQKAQHADLTAFLRRAQGDAVADAFASHGVRELWELTSAIRHGEGRAMSWLAENARHIWIANGDEEFEDFREAGALGQIMWLSDVDLHRYAMTVLRFWHTAGGSLP